jgi:hypothetical protein
MCQIGSLEQPNNPPNPLDLVRYGWASRNLPQPSAFSLILISSTLIDSTPGVLKAWDTFCKDYNLGDPAEVAHRAHGRRLYDTLNEFCGIKDETTLQVHLRDIQLSWTIALTLYSGRDCAV